MRLRMRVNVVRRPGDRDHEAEDDDRRLLLGKPGWLGRGAWRQAEAKEAAQEAAQVAAAAKVVEARVAA